MKTTTSTTATVRSGRAATRMIVCVGMLAAISTILMLFEFPLPFLAPGFYELDFSEVPILIGAFALGPVAGVLTELVKVLLNLVVNFHVCASGFTDLQDEEIQKACSHRTGSRNCDYVSGCSVYQCTCIASGLCKGIWNAD